MGMSRRAYATHRGCSDTAVRKAIKDGRISIEPDGSIDPVKADAAWADNTDASQQRKETPEPRDIPSSAPAASSDVGFGENITIAKVQVAEKLAKTQMVRLRVAKMKGELVDRRKAEASVFDLARRERDAWINWPARVAANMAADLDIEPHAMEQVLTRYLRTHLADLAEIRVELR